MELNNEEKQIIINILSRVQLQVSEARVVLGIIDKLAATLPVQTEVKEEQK